MKVDRVPDFHVEGETRPVPCWIWGEYKPSSPLLVGRPIHARSGVPGQLFLFDPSTLHLVCWGDLAPLDIAVIPSDPQTDVWRYFLT